MYVLGIETSCDETAVSILACEIGRQVEIVSELVSSQIEIHQEYGGVVPELASREHLVNLPILIEKLFNDANLEISDIGLIGVTRGPGLKGCLLVGYDFTKAVSLARNIPFVGVNHIEGHLLAPFLDNPELSFPYIALIVSGGHTEIHIVRGVGDYTLCARTVDDAAGEAFDKSANLLGFNYPGGASLARLADSVQSSAYKLPKVMKHEESFSFSGLKTAISLLVQKERQNGTLPDTKKATLSHAIQSAIVETLYTKLENVIKTHDVNKVIISGGVAANEALRNKVNTLKGVTAFLPTPFHCTDNASMIAYVAWQRYLMEESSSFDTTVLSRWPVEAIYSPTPND